MKYSNRRNYRDQLIVEEETVVKKTIKKKKEENKLKGLLKKLLGSN